MAIPAVRVTWSAWGQRYYPPSQLEIPNAGGSRDAPTVAVRSSRGETDNYVVEDLLPKFLDEFRLEDLVNQAALLGKNRLDRSVRSVVEDDSVAADPQAIVPGKRAFQRPNLAPFMAQFSKRKPNDLAWFRGQASNVDDDLKGRTNRASHSGMSSSFPNFVRPALCSWMAAIAAALPMISSVSAIAVMRA